MAIDFFSSTAIKAMPDTVASHSVKLTQSQVSVPASTNAPHGITTDEVALTDMARLFAYAKAEADASDGVDYEKVAALKKQFDEGTFKIDPERIADKIISIESSFVIAD